MTDERPGGTPRRGLVMAAIAVCAGVLVALAGCSAAGDQSADGSVAAPSFEGPYAADFEQFYRDAVDDFVRDVLRDEQISDQELAETHERMRSCASGEGLSDIEFHEDGSADYNFPPTMGAERSTEVWNSCERSSGMLPVAALYYAMRANPNNERWSELVVACLVRNGVVAASYTADEYERDSMNGTIPYTDPQRGAMVRAQCEQHPRE